VLWLVILVFLVSVVKALVVLSYLISPVICGSEHKILIYTTYFEAG